MKIERLFVNICFLRGVCLLVCFAFLFSYSFSQTSDDQFRQPLKKVIVDIQNRYGVTIRYPEELVKDKWVSYA